MLSRHALRAVRAAAPARTFAAAAASANNGHPPIAVFGVDGTYATALVRASRVFSCY